MRIGKHRGGGRVIEGSTPNGEFRIELDAAADGRALRIHDCGGNVVGRGGIRFKRSTVPSEKPKCECSKSGVGDLLAQATAAAGIPACDSCKHRRDWMNRAGCRLNHWMKRVVDFLLPCGEKE